MEFLVHKYIKILEQHHKSMDKQTHNVTDFQILSNISNLFPPKTGLNYDQIKIKHEF